MPDQPPKDPPGEKSWIEKLGEKSAGLPQPPSDNPAPKDAGTNQLWRFAGLGIQFATTVALFAYAGYSIDQWRGWKSNQALLTLTLIALFGNMYLLIKEALKANK